MKMVMIIVIRHVWIHDRYNFIMQFKKKYAKLDCYELSMRSVKQLS